MKTPLVTLARPAWRTLVEATTDEPGKETFGYLVGRYTRVGARVHHVVMAAAVTSDRASLWYANGDAAKIEGALLKKYAPLEVIGKCHSHPYEEACIASLLPQLSDTDEFWVKRDRGEFCCRAEAWLRVRKGKIIPCQIKVS